MTDRDECYWEEGSLGRALHDIEEQAKQLGAYDSLAKVDQLRARMRNQRDDVLFGKEEA